MLAALWKTLPMKKIAGTALLLLQLLALHACHDSTSDRQPAKLYHVANGCYVVGAKDPGGARSELLSASESGEAYLFSRQRPRQATSFFLKPSGLGTYLFFGDGESYLVSDGSGLLRQSELLSDVLTVDDDFRSDAEWALESAPRRNESVPHKNGRKGHRHIRLRHLLSGRWLTTKGLVADPREAAEIRLLPSTGCAEFPEASLDASGRARPRRFRDGSLFGFVDTHSHLLTNFAFGGEPPKTASFPTVVIFRMASMPLVKVAILVPLRTGNAKST